MASCKSNCLPLEKVVKTNQANVLETKNSVSTRTLGWNNLAPLVLVKIFSFLPYRDRASAALACRWWYQVYNSNLRTVWKNCLLHFERDSDVGALKALKRYASHLEEVIIYVRQADPKNRRRGLQALELLKKASDLKSIKLEFTGENLMSQGEESGSDYGYTEHLERLFSSPGIQAQVTERTTEDRAGPAGVTIVDLGNVKFLVPGYFLEILQLQLHSSLTTLNLQSSLPDNSRWTCKIYPPAMTRLVTKCKNLSELKCCYRSISDDVLSILAERDRAPLRILSMQLRCSDWNTALTEEAWRKLFAQWPNHRSCVIFSGNPTLEHIIKYCPISLVVVCVEEKSATQSDIDK